MTSVMDLFTRLPEDTKYDYGKTVLGYEEEKSPFQGKPIDWRKHPELFKEHFGYSVEDAEKKQREIDKELGKDSFARFDNENDD